MLAERAGGKFVVVASSAGTNAKAAEAIYVATKHAQVGLARSLGLENDRDDLTVCLVLPGGMKTGMWDGFNVPEFDEFSDPEVVARKIVDQTEETAERFLELEIPRGAVNS